MNTELEEMREQLATLKKKLEKQEIISERLISKTKESLEKDLKSLGWKYKRQCIACLLTIPLCYYIFVHQCGFSVAFGICTGIISFISFAFIIWNRRKLYDHLLTDNLVEAQQRVSIAKKRHIWWVKNDYAMLIVWTVWYALEIYQKCTTENLSDLTIPMYIGGAVGLIISIPFGIWNVIKTQRHYQKILDQIEDLRTEGK